MDLLQLLPIKSTKMDMYKMSLSNDRCGQNLMAVVGLFLVSTSSKFGLVIGGHVLIFDLAKRMQCCASHMSMWSAWIHQLSRERCS